MMEGLKEALQYITGLKEKSMEPKLVEGMIGMIDRNSSNVSVNVQNQNREFDYEKFGRAAADAMITAGIGFKCDEREFARLIKDLIDYV